MCFGHIFFLINFKTAVISVNCYFSFPWCRYHVDTRRIYNYSSFLQHIHCLHHSSSRRVSCGQQRRNNETAHQHCHRVKQKKKKTKLRKKDHLQQVHIQNFSFRVGKKIGEKLELHLLPGVRTNTACLLTYSLPPPYNLCYHSIHLLGSCR